jgi:hypothetical protein
MVENAFDVGNEAHYEHAERINTLSAVLRVFPKRQRG